MAGASDVFRVVQGDRPAPPIPADEERARRAGERISAIP